MTSPENPYTPPKENPETISDGPYVQGDLVISKTSLRHNHLCILTGQKLPQNVEPQKIDLRRKNILVFEKPIPFNGYIDPNIFEKHRATIYIIFALMFLAIFLSVALRTPGHPLIPPLALYLIYAFLAPKIHPLRKIKIIQKQNNLFHISGIHPNLLKTLPSNPTHTP